MSGTLEHYAVGATIGTALSGIVFGYLKWKLDHNQDHRADEASQREDVATLIQVNAATVAALEKQNALLEQQIEEYKRRESRSMAREAEWRAEKRRLETKVDALDESYKQLVQAITQGRVCLDADHCDDYNSGDRRHGADTDTGQAYEKPGGTD